MRGRGGRKLNLLPKSHTAMGLAKGKKEEGWGTVSAKKKTQKEGKGELML